MTIKNRIEVRIHGQNYTIVGDEPEEYIQKLSSYVDQKMDEVTKSSNKLSTTMAAVLTAINIGDDCFKNKEELDKLKYKLSRYESELKKLTAQVEQYKQINQELKSDIQNLRIELVKKETELKEFIENFDNECKNNTVSIDSARRFAAK